MRRHGYETAKRLEADELVVDAWDDETMRRWERTSPDGAVAAPDARPRTAKPIALAGHRSRPYAAFSGGSYVYLWTNRPPCRLCPTERHTPLPRSQSVVVEVTKIVAIARPEVVIVDHFEAT